MKKAKANSNTSYTLWTLSAALIIIGLVVGLSPSTSAEVGTTRLQKPSQTSPRIDVVFTIDATGSMGDEIDMVKKEIWTIANRLMEGKPRPDIRFGLVFYQDRGDAFVAKRTELTRNIDEIHKELMTVSAQGGGDWREHVGRGLHEATSMQWDASPNTTRVIYLVGDAPSHDDYNDGYSVASAIEVANAKTIKINTIGCSGLSSGQSEFQSIASRTGGSFMPLTYQAIVKDDLGVKRSVIYFDGDMYEAEGVLNKKAWGRGGKSLIKSGKLKKARPSLRSKAAAPGAATENNLDSLLEEDLKSEAKEKGVDY
jgi:Mg-chelatase subunit ChlD